MHFRRPEVTVDGSDVTVHTEEERAPVKLTLHHKENDLIVFDNYGHFIFKGSLYSNFDFLQNNIFY